MASLTEPNDHSAESIQAQKIQYIFSDQIPTQLHPEKAQKLNESMEEKSAIGTPMVSELAKANLRLEDSQGNDALFTEKPQRAELTASAQNVQTKEQEAQVANEEYTLSAIPQKRPSIVPVATAPIGRRSVQFARPALSPSQEQEPHLRSKSWDFQNGELPGRDRLGNSLFSRIRAMAYNSSSAAHSRSPSTYTMSGDSTDEHTPVAPFSQRFEGGESSTPGEGSEIEADAEQSTGEDSILGSPFRRKKRKSRRPFDKQIETAPSTPKISSRPHLLSSTSLVPGDRFRPGFSTRRATVPDLPTDNPQGVSEDEGRQRLARSSPWRRSTAWVHGSRGLGYSGGRNTRQQAGSQERRPSNFRRFTGIGSGVDGVESSPFSSWKFSRGERGEQGHSANRAKWRQRLRMMGQRRKAENTIDHAKSAELLAELTAGVPAALILASMFQRDEHGNRRIPILLEQLKVQIPDSNQTDSKSGDRHTTFRIDLEYGNGLTRMKWSIHRSLRDFTNLHAKYKLQIGAQKYIQLRGDDARTKLPHFPRGSFPYLRGIRGLDSDTEDDEDQDEDATGLSGGDVSGPERSNRKKKRRAPPFIVRRKSTSQAIQSGDDTSTAARLGIPVRREPYPARQRKKLEVYLQKMIRYLIFRPESNRLCKFLELSALGVRLAAEGSYHGKEGFLAIQSGKAVDFRTALKSLQFVGRNSFKWFVVRHSYIVCVDSPGEMNIHDVFLVDSSFQMQTKRKRLRDQKPRDLAKTAKESASYPQHHSLKLRNSERKLKLLAKNERQLHQFLESIRFMSESTAWKRSNRFGSFAPVRSDVFSQWLVDGRDYMWNVSRAISMARDVIYIHDWWLSPELYMRRPAAISQKWRLDRLLQRKAQEGVKIFVIVYRNINSAIPIDSEHTKFSLLDLHPNVFVQRSPNQIRQNTFFWAHHEKICIVDHLIAFVGGIDLCFGRWDTPHHLVTDDKPTGFEFSGAPKDADHCQLWPGKDYSNPRIQDFYALDKPYEEMYDRFKVPRMPWHDISMQIVGQPARDLTRHFVQRWNFILRQRTPTRPTPFLLPPPDFDPEEVRNLGLNGTCEVQILRSACWWSIGTPDKTEHSIMTTYIKMIEQSEHFVYIENQFFISSCEVEGTRIENRIGDALVERIIRASQRGEGWRAVIIIPLMPGFQNAVDNQDGTSVRLIMQCQFRSICRGESSLFSRIRAEGIEPEDYIQFYSLRSWGRIGQNKQLVTEQLYIHAKCMIVDDRVAIIGSANINERSMLGSRDSECAAVVRDTDMLRSTMNYQPYLVGRFPHTLRMRLMREHLGIDVDDVVEKERRKEEEDGRNDHWERDLESSPSERDNSPEDKVNRKSNSRIRHSKQNHQIELPTGLNSAKRYNCDRRSDQPGDPNLNDDEDLILSPNNLNHSERNERIGRPVRRRTGSKKEAVKDSKTRDRAFHNVKQSVSPRRSQSRQSEFPGNDALPPSHHVQRDNATHLSFLAPAQLPALPNTDDTDIEGPPALAIPEKVELVHPSVADMKRVIVDKDCMLDPLNDAFFYDTWHAIAENNTRLYRTVFRCMPDNEVKSWKEYKEYAAYAERFSQAQGGGKSKDRVQQEATGSSGPPGQVHIAEKLGMLGSAGGKTGDAEAKVETLTSKIAKTLSGKENNSEINQPLGKVEDWAEQAGREQAVRQEQEREAANAYYDSTNIYSSADEKAAMQSPHGGSKEFPPLEPTSLEPDCPSKREASLSVSYSEALNQNSTGHKSRRRTTTHGSKREFRASDDLISRADAEKLMKLTQGHLVMWPYDWYVLVS